MWKHLIVVRAGLVALVCSPCFPPALAQSAQEFVKINPLRDAYYGDLHLHTSYSFDAYLMGTTQASPEEAYRFARGEVVNYMGQPARRHYPLDFLAVTDHSESIGVLSALEDPDSAVSRSEHGRKLRAFFSRLTGPDGRRSLGSALKEPNTRTLFEAISRDYYNSSELPDELKAVSRSAWDRVIELANRYYLPGRFTTFIAYEWSATPASANLHRNVIFRGNSAPYPFTSRDSMDPGALWTWLEAIRRGGVEALAIPHNGNASDGLMYDWVSAMSYMDRGYAERRERNEPVSEIAQNKGTSETHPLLSPNDEFADYEIYDFLESQRGRASRLQGSYLREALGAGLVLQNRFGANPFKYGFVGSSDLHSGLSISEQSNYGGSLWRVNVGGGRATKDEVANGFAGERDLINLKTTAGALTGVWAVSNTREGVYDALHRRETFATSGTRMKIRFFGGWNFSKTVLQAREWVATAYARGVPMGGDLPARRGDNGPTFLIWAGKDPNGAKLDRVQVIKVWAENGRQKEKVFDAVWAGARTPDLKNGEIAAIREKVNLETGRYRDEVGATELKTMWRDPEFDPSKSAAYYLRVLEAPTPRWSTLLAIQHGLSLPNGVPTSVQQRGWSSPIWYTP